VHVTPPNTLMRVAVSVMCPLRTVSDPPQERAAATPGASAHGAHAAAHATSTTDRPFTRARLARGGLAGA
jgi:hypothetical protein